MPDAGLRYNVSALVSFARHPFCREGLRLWDFGDFARVSEPRGGL